MEQILQINFTRINRALGEDIENIFPHRYHPLAVILGGSVVTLTFLILLIHQYRNIICTKFSYYHILCFNYCTWKGDSAGDCGQDSDWDRTRRHVGVNTNLSSTDNTDVSHLALAGMFSRLHQMKPPASPPPPYEPPPSYSIAVLMSDNEAYIVSQPVLV